MTKILNQIFLKVAEEMDDDEGEGDDDLNEMQVTKKTVNVNGGGLEETGSEIGAAPLPFDQVRISCTILRNNNKIFVSL